VPDSPVDLTEDYTQRSASTLGLTWTDGADPGGLAIQDYRITITQDDTGFEQTVLGVTSRQYKATDLTFGLYYNFQVEAQNQYGYSLKSETLVMLCAWKPEKPDAPVTYVVGNMVYVDWASPVLNGVPITGYRVYIRESDGVTFTLENASCDGSTAEVIANEICQIPLATLIVAPYSLGLN
jgi:hypothetical protein